MQRGPLRLLILLVIVGALLSVGVTAVAADHGEEADDREIIEVQSVTNDPETGIAHVELQYHIGDDVAGMRTQLADDGFEVVATDGFSQIDDAEYEWDEQRNTPSISVRVEVNQTRANGYDYVDTGEWLLTGRPLRTGVRLAEDIDLQRTLAAGEEGVASEGMVYLGPYESYEFEADTERFHLVMTAAADPEWTPEEIGDRLVASNRALDVEAESEVLTVFAVTDPLRRGGLATGTNAEFWVHEAGLAHPQTTLYHEYVHTRQDYERADDLEWTIEGGADYYARLLALKDGTIEYHRFHRLLDDGNDFDDIVLADRESWFGTGADYELGALTLAVMDETLRTENVKFEDVFRAKNEASGELSDADFEALASDAGPDMSDFFETHIRSIPPESTVPRPTVYDGPNTDADPTLSVPEIDLGGESSERITVELDNPGTETSLAPEFAVDTPDGVSIELIDSDGSGVTETEEGWVLDHLPAGEGYELELEITAETVDGQQIEFIVADLSNQRDSTIRTLDSTQPLDVTLDLPDSATVGDSITAAATASLDDSDIEGYRFEISSPEATETIDTEESSITFTAEHAGEYTVSVTVTATDGRTASTSGTLDIAPSESEEEETTDDETADEDETTDEETAADEETDDDAAGTTDDDTDGDEDGTDTTDGTDTETSDDGGEQGDDGFGNGFGPVVALIALISTVLVGLHRRD